MDVTQLATHLQQALQLNDELRSQQASLLQMTQQVQAENAALRQQLETLRHDHEALVASTQTLMADREQRQRREAELEAINQRLVDMLWGRRSERREFSPDQLLLSFPEEAPQTEEEQTVIMAEQQAEEARDAQLVQEAAARRRRRREEQRQTREFPEHLERRERVLDLSEDQKQGLQRIGVMITERLRFEKPHMYVEVIKRPQYVVAGAAGEGRERAAAAVDHCRGLQVRLQRGGGDRGAEVRLPCADLSAAGLVRPVWLVPQPSHGERSDELRRGHGRSALPADVAVVAAAADPAGRRHNRVLLLTRNSLSEEREAVLHARRTSRDTAGSGTTGGK